MSEDLEQRMVLSETLRSLLETPSSEFVSQWLEGVASSPCEQSERQARITQAVHFLHALSDGLLLPTPKTPMPPAAIDATLRAEYPLVFHTSAMLQLAILLFEQIDTSHSQTASIPDVLSMLHLGLQSMPHLERSSMQIHDRLACLSQFSSRLNGLRDQDSIMHYALTEVPALLNAHTAAIWLWDRDQHIPLVHVTAEQRSAAWEQTESFTRLLKMTCEQSAVFTIEAEQADENWPDTLQARSVAFLPLPAPDGCVGILTVGHVIGERFSDFDILLLSSLASLIAAALHNVQLHANERHLVNLLLRSIRQVVQTTSSTDIAEDEFIQSLLQVAEGMTRANTLCAMVQLEQEPMPLVVTSGSSQAIHHQHYLHVAEMLFPHITEQNFPQEGQLCDLPLDLPEELHLQYYTWTPVHLGDKLAGLVVAFHDQCLSAEQSTFLRTMSEQLGVGLENQQQANRQRRLLIELSRVTYISETISASFDPQLILSTITNASSQALNVPVALCGWLTEDGSLRVLPDTVCGMAPDLVAQMKLTCNNSVIHNVLDLKNDVTSAMLGARASSAFPVLRDIGMVDWACVPMTVKSKARGILLIADRKPRVFSNRELALLDIYATQGGLALENTLLIDQVSNQLRQIDQLYHVARAVSSTLDPEGILQALTEATCTAFEAPSVLVTLTDGAEKEQRVAAVTGLPVGLLGKSIPANEGILGTALQRNESIISQQLASDGRSTFLRDLARAEGISTSLTVPMQGQGGTLGTLTVFTAETRDFNLEQIHLLQTIATEAAVAMQNARLYHQERELARGLREMVSNLSERVQGTLALLVRLFDISQQSGEARNAPGRPRLRLQLLAALESVIPKDHPSEVDIREVFMHLLRERHAEFDQASDLSVVQVTGARLFVPTRFAAPLGLLILEWLCSGLDMRPEQAAEPITLAFQQMGRDSMIHVDYPGEWFSAHATGNSAIIAAVQDLVPGILTETRENALYRLRYRFTTSAWESRGH